jgi:hypothetical protein
MCDMDPTDSRPQDLKALENELQAIYGEFRVKVIEPKSYWNLHYGPIHLRARMSSQRIVGIFISFCLVTLLGGALATFFSVTEELGIALVVGSMFTGGSFLIQYWSTQVDHERGAFEALESEREKKAIADFATRINLLTSNIEAIDPMYFTRKSQE